MRQRAHGTANERRGAVGGIRTEATRSVRYEMVHVQVAAAEPRVSARRWVRVSVSPARVARRGSGLAVRRESTHEDTSARC